MGGINPGMLSSETDDWPTPIDLFLKLHYEFAFNLDPCATHYNHKCSRYFDKEDNGLLQPWSGRVFMNPPYGRQIGQWIEKAYRESREPFSCTVVCLIPARTDTAYWHDYIMKAAEIRFIKARLNFTNPRQDARVAAGESQSHNAPFPSVVVVFRPGHEGPPVISAIERDGTPVVAATAVQPGLEYGGAA